MTTAAEAPIDIAGQCLWTDYLEAQRTHRQKRGWRRVGWIALWVLITGQIGLFALAALGDSQWAWPLGLLVAVLAANVWFERVRLPRYCRRIYDQQRGMREPFRSWLSATEIRSETALGTSAHDWTAFIRWRESAGLFLLYQSDCLFNMVPKRSFGSEAELVRFRRLLTERLGPAA
jgi:hypothetical protein